MVAKRQTPAQSVRRTRRGPYTRRQILNASLHLFSERGFARTTVRDIAREAGITDAAIYYHFQSKQELLEALTEEGGFLTSLQNLEQVEAALPIREMVLWMTAGAVNLMDANRDFLRLITIEGLGGENGSREQYSRLLDLWESALATVLRRYEACGSLREGVADDLSRHIIYTIMMAFQDSLFGRHGFSADNAHARQEAIRAFLGPSLERLLASEVT